MTSAVGDGYRTLHSGTWAEVSVLDAMLADDGLHPHIEDSNLKVLDPFITGGNIFEVTLRVPEREWERACELLVEFRQRQREAAQHREPEVEDAHALGRRLRWTTFIALPATALPPLFLLVAGYVSILLMNYLSAAKDEQEKPSGHGFNLLAAAFVLIGGTTVTLWVTWDFIQKRL